MEYRLVGRTGIRVSPICLGTANFADPTAPEEAARIMDAAMDAGINHLDTGDSYGGGRSEEIIGDVLKRANRRDEIILTTKFNPPTGPGPNDRGNSRRHVLKACDDSLRRLQTDYIDFYLAHRPAPEIPIDETLGALDDLVRQGKVRYIGCSTHPAWRVMEAIMVSERKGLARYVVEQPPYSLLDRRIEVELVPMCQEYGIGIMTWSPLGMGILAGRYRAGAGFPEDSRGALRGGIYAERITDAGVAIGERFARLAEETDYSPAELALLWVKDQPGITAPIFGPRTTEQLVSVLRVLDARLSDDLRQRCDELVPPGAVVADFHNTSGWTPRPPKEGEEA